ncbi:MAG: TIM barrel protein [Planctomycetes bacterium]|nr:TIM barrel protein [Planctomycetota bacterium]
MFPSIFTDELGLDFPDALPILKSWGLAHCDLRGRVFRKAFEDLTPEELAEARRLLDLHGLKLGALQSSLAKVHLPDGDHLRAEERKLEGVIRAADALGCRLVRSFFYWQPPRDLEGQLAVRPDELQKALDRFAPLADHAQKAGLVLAFENCGTTPDECFALLDALAVPTWGFAWDVHSSWDCEERRRNPAAFLIRMAQRARLVHVKAHGAVPGHGEPIPYDKVLATLDNAGLRGPVSAETHNPDPAVPHADMSRRVVEAIQRAWPTAAPGRLFDTAKKPAPAPRPWADDPVRFVVVGLGMGHSRAKMVQETPGARLVGVCDIVEERARRTADACHVPYETDVRRWLDNKEVEAVFVLTETGNHAAVALACLEAGKHALVTKPMDATLAACDAMVRLAEAKGLTLAVDFSRRVESGPLSLRAAVQNGRFGRLLSGDAALKVLRTMDYYRSNGGWRGTRRWDGGGVLSNQNIHHLDELVFALGVPSRVRCSIWTQDHAIEAEDLGVAAWEYGGTGVPPVAGHRPEACATGPVVSVGVGTLAGGISVGGTGVPPVCQGLVLTLYATSSYPHSTWYFRFDLHGTQGAVVQASGGPFEKPLERWFLDGAWGPNAPDHAESPWANNVDNFAAHLRAGAPLVCDGREGRRSQAVLDAMYRSAYEADGGWVPVHPELP